MTYSAAEGQAAAKKKSQQDSQGHWQPHLQPQVLMGPPIAGCQGGGRYYTLWQQQCSETLECEQSTVLKQQVVLLAAVNLNDETNDHHVYIGSYTCINQIVCTAHVHLNRRPWTVPRRTYGMAHVTRTSTSPMTAMWQQTTKSTHRGRRDVEQVQLKWIRQNPRS